MNPRELTIKEVLKGYQAKSFKPSEIISAYVDAIEKLNPTLNAFLQTRPDQVLNKARALDQQMSKADSMPLFGIPIAVKDNFLVKDWQCTAGSKILQNYVAKYTATCVERLEQAGAIVVGKTNLDEFAMGSSNENSAYGVVKNPWDVSRVPGGSSGGSASAVAAGLCMAALGTDTGGSVRQPASLCGVVGLKPTYGRVSRYGMVAFGSSLDQAGPLTKDNWDSARVLEVMAGYGGKDSTLSRSVVPQYTEQIHSGRLKGLRVGVFRKILADGIDADVKKSFEEVLQKFTDEGSEIVDIELPHIKYGLSCYYLIAPSEASSNLARFDGVHYGHRSASVNSVDDVYFNSRGEGFGPEVKLRIMLGTYALSSGYYDAYYIKANRVRSLIRSDFSNAFEKCDVIVSPTSPSTAFKLGEKTEDPIQMYLSDIFTLPASLAGIPATSVPCGLDSQGLPIGVQFIGKAFDEGTLFQVAHAYEAIRGVFQHSPLVAQQ